MSDESSKEGMDGDADSPDELDFGDASADADDVRAIEEEKEPKGDPGQPESEDVSRDRSSAWESARDLQQRISDMLDSPGARAIAEQQKRLARMLDSPGARAIAEQQRRLARMLDMPAMRALAQQQRRLADLLDAPGTKAILQQKRLMSDLFEKPALQALAQQRHLAELASGPALESLARQQTQIAKLAGSPALRAMAAHQQRWNADATVSLAQGALESPAFRNAYLGRSRSLAEAFSKVEVDPGWKRTLRSLQKSEELAHWARSVAEALDQEQPATTAVREATEALLGSYAVQGALEHAHEADTSGFEEVVAASAYALEAAQVGTEGAQTSSAGDSRRLADADADADAEIYRALIQLWGGSQVVMVVVVATLITGQPLVLLATLAALSQITGYSLKDLFEWLGRTINH